MTTHQTGLRTGLDRLGSAPGEASLPQGASTWRPRRAIAVALMTAAVIALLQVVQSGSFAHTGQTLQRLEAERDVLRAEVHTLEAEVASLASLERTERVARERLGMVPAQEVRRISVGVQAPSGPLLPRPLVQPSTQPETDRPWWQSLYQALPLP